MKQIFSTYIKNFKLYLIKIILSVFRFINNYINIVITNATKYVELSNKGYLTLLRVKYHPKMKYLELTYCNNHLLEQYKALKELHKSLFGSEEFLKLGYHKVILVMAIIGKQTFSHACFIIISLLTITLLLSNIMIRLKIISRICMIMAMKLIRWINSKY